jgi:hypothetical protein
MEASIALKLFGRRCPGEITVSSSRPPQTETMSTTVGFLVRTVSSERGSRPPCCPDCKLPLNLIQPDENEPSRLLGICEDCSRWVYLVELEPDWRKTIMVELPPGDAMQRELAEAKTPQSGHRGTGPGSQRSVSSGS